MRALFLSLAAFCILHGADLEGTVTSPDGSPVMGVLAMGDGPPQWAYTDAHGRYVIRGRLTAVSFRMKGFKPLTLIVGDSGVVDARLEPGEPEWHIPSCEPAGPLSSTRMHFKAVGPVKQDAGYADVDYSGRIFVFKSQKRFYMRTMSGPYGGGGRPPSQVYTGSSSFSEREWVAGDLVGLDARGISRDGTYWRWVGPLIAEMATYKGASAEAAKAFDAVLDSMCIARRP